MRVKLLLAVQIMIFGCSTHEVTTAEEWCDQLAGVDMFEKYTPSWAVLPAIKWNADAIRDDFVQQLNTAQVQKVDEQSSDLAWREGAELHVWNLGTFLEIEPEWVIEEWRDNIELSKKYENPDDAHRCVYGTITSLFDNLHIHTGIFDQYTYQVVDKYVTTIPTERHERLKDPL